MGWRSCQPGWRKGRVESDMTALEGRILSLGLGRV